MRYFVFNGLQEISLFRYFRLDFTNFYIDIPILSGYFMCRLPMKLIITNLNTHGTFKYRRNMN